MKRLTLRRWSVAGLVLSALIVAVVSYAYAQPFVCSYRRIFVIFRGAGLEIAVFSKADDAQVGPNCAHQDDLRRLTWSQPFFFVRKTQNGRREAGMGLPLWIPLAVIGIPSLIAWRRSRRRSGHCTKCSYNLTGNISGVCPECGMPVDKKRGDDERKE